MSETLSGVELVERATTKIAFFKDVGAELGRRSPDDDATAALIEAYRSERMPAWMAAYLLGCARGSGSYEVARQILIAAPGMLAESYAGTAMARIDDLASHDDLASLIVEAAHLRSREGAARGLGIVAQQATCLLLADAVRAGRIRTQTASTILSTIADIVPQLLEWLAQDDELTARLAFAAATTILLRDAGPAQTALSKAVLHALDSGRMKMSPLPRAELLARIHRET